MKKRIFAVLAAVIVLCMSTTVFAAESTTSKATSKTEGVTVSEVKAETKTAATTQAKEKGYTVVDVFELTLDATKAVKESDGTYKVVISIAGIAKSDNVKVLHFVDNAWEELAATAGDGTVTFNTKSFSPFAIVKVPESAAKSPKTGNEIPVAALIACVALAGLAVSIRGAKRNVE